jgi:hypothetical protein
MPDAPKPRPNPTLPAGGLDDSEVLALEAQYAGEPIFQVMTDQWGHDEHAAVHGELVRQSDMPGHYDFDWALKMGVLRRAPEYARLFAAPPAAGTDRPSTTRPQDNLSDAQAVSEGRSGFSVGQPGQQPAATGDEVFGLGLTTEQEEALLEAGYQDRAAVLAASDEELDQVKGIGPATVKRIREAG